MSDQRPRGIGNRLAPARFVVWALLLAAAVPILWQLVDWRYAIMLAFDAATLVFFLSCIPLFGHEAGQMREAAARNDANRAGLLAITAAVAFVILITVVSELQTGPHRPAEIALIVGTLVMAWTFSNLIYAFHYAHAYYADEDGHDLGGFDFPATPEPEYWDFVYLAFCLGMTFQTSDITIKTTRLRILVTFHCLAAFVFNLGVLAFTINSLGG